MIKLFEQFNNEQEIKDICKKYNIENYTINSDGSIDVDDNVVLVYYSLIKIPLKFNKIVGDFYLNGNNLTSLEGCPKYISGNFHLSRNRSIKNLENSPEHIGGKFFLDNTNLETLNGLKVSYSKIYGLGDSKQKLVRKHKLSNFIED